ncbi:hypothetical protein DOJK_01898 [Patescibacteria group bacterium]|nr:hypothetical protein DOJK_01898 [Patescibacteria group bacterium]
MSNSVLDTTNETQPDIVAQRKQEVARILQEVVGTLNPKVREQFFTGEATPITSTTEIEATVERLEDAVDSSEGREEDKIAIKASLRSVVMIYSSLNQVGEEDYRMLVEIINKLRDMLSDGVITNSETAEIKDGSETIRKTIERLEKL